MSLRSSKLMGIQLGTKLNYKMLLKLDPRNAIPVLELVPNLLVSEISKRLTTSEVWFCLIFRLCENENQRTNRNTTDHAPYILMFKVETNLIWLSLKIHHKK